MTSPLKSRNTQQRNTIFPSQESLTTDGATSASPTTPTLVLTPQEAADALRVDRSTLYQLLMRGEIRSFKIGRCRRIPLNALEEWIVRQSAPEIQVVG